MQELPAAAADRAPPTDTDRDEAAACCSATTLLDALRASLMLASAAATITLLLWLRVLTAHSCLAASHLSEARAAHRLEAAADAFRPVNATIQILNLQLCSGCWPFGKAQPEQTGWLEGTYTYRWNGESFMGHQFASATTRGHLSQYDRLSRALALGTPVTAWVDPARPATAVLDRTHYVHPREVGNALFVCQAGACVRVAVFCLGAAPLLFIWVAGDVGRSDVETQALLGGLTLMFGCVYACGIALLKLEAGDASA